VLIVEDDRAARRAIAKILQRQGFAVSEAATVADAMSGLASHPPHWILLDLMLPDGCGLDVLRKVRAERMSSRTCIITGCASEMINAARDAGAEHTFVKPLDVDRLVTVMTANGGGS
jgi:DNA-binding response OmpR family regulator